MPLILFLAWLYIAVYALLAIVILLWRAASWPFRSSTPMQLRRPAPTIPQPARVRLEPTFHAPHLPPLRREPTFTAPQPAPAAPLRTPLTRTEIILRQAALLRATART
jgi:hypothetical protein